LLVEEGIEITKPGEWPRIKLPLHRNVPHPDARWPRPDEQRKFEKLTRSMLLDETPQLGWYTYVNILRFDCCHAPGEKWGWACEEWDDVTFGHSDPQQILSELRTITEWYRQQGYDHLAGSWAFLQAIEPAVRTLGLEPPRGIRSARANILNRALWRLRCYLHSPVSYTARNTPEAYSGPIWGDWDPDVRLIVLGLEPWTEWDAARALFSPGPGLLEADWYKDPVREALLWILKRYAECLDMGAEETERRAQRLRLYFDDSLPDEQLPEDLRELRRRARATPLPSWEELEREVVEDPGEWPKWWKEPWEEEGGRKEEE
jgi:hypothetical protein